MNNSYENNSFENNDIKDVQNEYKVYSKSYTPGENGYTEQKQSYQGGEYSYNYISCNAGVKKAGKNKKFLPVLAVIMCTLVLCAGTGIGTAFIVSGHYDSLFEENKLLYGESDDKETQGTVEFEEPGKGHKENQDWFFGFNDDTSFPCDFWEA